MWHERDWGPALTIKMSSSSKMRNGASITFHRDMIKHMVVKERSPPDKDCVFLVAEAFSVVSTCT